MKEARVVAVAFGLACLVVSAYHLARLVGRRSDPAGDALHAAMGLGMAAMFVPALAPLPQAVWVAVFGVGGTWFASVALRGGGHSAVHHVVGAIAMLVMLLAGHAAPTPDGGGGHVAHGGGPDGALDWTMPIALVLAAYFVWYLLRCTEPLRAAAAPGAVLTRVGVLADARVAAVAHAVMAVAMAVMLLGAV